MHLCNWPLQSYRSVECQPDVLCAELLGLMVVVCRRVKVGKLTIIMATIGPMNANIVYCSVGSQHLKDKMEK